MKVRVVTLEEIMRRIANGDSMDSYQAIHKMKMFEGEYAIQKVTEVRINDLMSDEYVIVEIYWKLTSPGWNMLGLLAFLSE